MLQSDSLFHQLQTSLNEFRKDLAPNRLLAALPIGLMNGLTAVLVVISLSSLIFAQALPADVPRGVALGLMATFIGGLVMLLFSSYPATIYVVQDGPAAIMSLAAVGIVARLSASPEKQLPSVLAAVALGALLTGLTFFLLGRFQLGNLIRFLPYPVIGGFLAGTGWLLFKGSLELLAGSGLSFQTYFGADALLRWLPPLALAVTLLFVLRRFSHPFLLAVFSLILVLGFYGVLALTGTSLASAQAAGWLMAGMPDGAAWQPLTAAELARVDWPAVFSQSGNILTAIFTSLVALLLGASGLEISVRRPISLNQELKASGVANLVSGLLSGFIGYPTISLSVMGKRIGLETRVFGMLTGLVSLAMLLLGLGALRYFPMPLLGFLLFFFGLSFLSEWLLDGFRRLSRSDYAIVWLILIIIASIGFLEGVLLGLLFSVVLFVLSYSQVSVVSRELDGRTYASRVDRRPGHRAVLDEAGNRALVLRLQGYVFFGTANSVQTRLQARLDQPAQLNYVILDFQHVARLDSSAINNFAMMRMRAEALGFVLLFSGLSSEQRAQLEREGFKDDLAAHMRIFKSLDDAMEWCEEEILIAEERGRTVAIVSLEKLLKEKLPKGTDVKTLAGYFERQEFGDSHVLVRQGDPPRGLYFLETGRARVEMHEPDGDRAWLRTMEAGVIFGEMQVYSGQSPSATVTTEGPTVVYYLSVKRLAALEKEHPALAIVFHRFVATVIGERLLQQNMVVNRLREE